MILRIILLLPVLTAINCGGLNYITLATGHFNFTSDRFFTQDNSIQNIVRKLPDSITHFVDIELLKMHRTTAPNHSQFSYLPILGFDGEVFVIMFTFAETTFRNKGERVFNIKLGDQIIFTVDIVTEVGYGKVLHKWIELVLKESVVYYNSTIVQTSLLQPILNAFNFQTKELRIVFQSVVGSPRIDTLVVMKGTDARNYIQEFLIFEKEKYIISKQYISKKYRRQPKLSYRPITQNDIIIQTQTQLDKFINKFYRMRTLGSILCAIFAIYHNSILQKCKELIKKLWNKDKDEGKEKEKEKEKQE